MEYKLRAAGLELSTGKIQEVISGANVTVLEYDKKPVYMKLDKDVLHDEIRRALGMDKILQCNNKEQMKKILGNKISG